MKVLIGAAAVCLASCSQAEGIVSSPEGQMVEICEAYIKSKLRAPSSYKQIAVQQTERSVAIEYDAVNTFNAPLREQEKCFFPEDAFEPDGLDADALQTDASRLATEDLPCCDIGVIAERAEMEAQAMEDMNAGMESVGSGFDDWAKENGL